MCIDHCSTRNKLHYAFGRRIIGVDVSANFDVAISFDIYITLAVEIFEETCAFNLQAWLRFVALSPVSSPQSVLFESEIGCFGLLQTCHLVSKDLPMFNECRVIRIGQLGWCFGSKALLFEAQIAAVCQWAIAGCPTTLLLQLVS